MAKKPSCLTARRHRAKVVGRAGGVILGERHDLAFLRSRETPQTGHVGMGGDFVLLKPPEKPLKSNAEWVSISWRIGGSHSSMNSFPSRKNPPD